MKSPFLLLSLRTFHSFEKCSSRIMSQTICHACGQYPCFKPKTLCPRCLPRCHDIISTPQEVYLTALDERSVKYMAVKQTFLSRWYGHGGCGVRVEQVIAVFNPKLHTAYLDFSKQWCAKSAKGDPFLNERRLFFPAYPSCSCNAIINMTAPPTPVFAVPKAPHQNQGALVNKPVSVCDDPSCELCTWLRVGLPTSMEGRTGSIGSGYYLSYEPSPIPKPEGQRAEPPKLTSEVPNSDRKRRICFLARCLVGNTFWMGESTSKATNLANLSQWDSVLVERNGFSECVIPARAAVLPVYLIVCSSEY